MSKSMNRNGQDLTQRVRIGLTGLACVFLLVLLGAIFVKSVNDSEASRPPEPAATNIAGNAAQAGDDQPKEPLAELGIAPGNAPDKSGAAGPSPSRGGGSH
jgi:hypothetical protein